MFDFTLPVYLERGMVQIILLTASVESFKPSFKKIIFLGIFLHVVSAIVMEFILVNNVS